ncbi:histone deacetylase [Anabaena cylindrica FACHB-243]|uniref:Histone deacetylase superfamily n=1 Tax=Anabaena cylindrica (strain ATCC 27899 / PCC 7122) TaxID=272123 RepID=K9ZE03_ANACC|nr:MULTISPECIES: histone deacetylase [Anabaena]AFZ57443.1 histone deacetylase superfamily [Anabaena cylindrica PCC 7122]MBD2421124.1 histone deacetylase [Anabaena cylindrica FACHB-243]MBY5284088.1 histone deacetylase [Anabaena sp. CCAP 1446/1C]MBY5310658.1 histone deacetylase [Anabaena sp. CCAP 1446/1C]MCM2405879.1 histone deacetylase [Anabaena sp. CCAP 1446/1C]
MLPVIYSDEFLEHQTGRYHPEKPERLIAIVNALKSASFAEKIEWLSPTLKLGLMSWIETAHTATYISKLQAIASSGGGYLDGDTPISPRSYDVALLAVSAWLEGVDVVLAKENPAFVLARPPGHHAESDAGMGFCLFSNAAIAALYALQQPGVNRVAILDWDVHHGNGTQAIVETHSQIAYCSLHQYPAYPGTGKASEKGLHQNVLNLPLPPGSDINVYQPLWKSLILPFLNKFQPDLLIISAGYDALADDPLASVNLQPEDFGLFTEYCLGVTRKILFGLEGGYDLSSLSKSVVATIERCLG